MRSASMLSLALFFAVFTTLSPASAKSHHHRHHHLKASSDSAPFAPMMMSGGPEPGMVRPQSVPMQQMRRDRRARRNAEALGQPPANFGSPAWQPVMAEPERPTRQQRRAMHQSAGLSAFGSAGNAGISPGGTGIGFGGTSLVAEARRWIGGNPTGRSSLWCGNFMNFVLSHTGHPTSSSNMARSFASYGHRLPGPQVGAIAVMSRGRGGGHVGVVSGIDPNGNPIIISGNHGHRVGEGVYPRGRIYAYVAP